MRKTLRTKLEEIRNVSTMDNANFSLRYDDKYPVVLNNDEELNCFIKSTIRLWISTWITGALDDILKRYI